MNAYQAPEPRTTIAALTSAVARLGRRVAGVLAECDYAQRRMLALRTSPDAYLPDGGRAPENYAEFLFRTSGMLMHEPTAARR
jgi:hypothetical protein